MALHSRIKRINEELRSVIAEIIQNEVRDPRLTEVMVTVTKVDTTRDLHQAQVYISLMGSREEAKAAMEALDHSQSFIRRATAAKVNLRTMPELLFTLDDTVQNAARINAVLRKIEKDNPEAFQEPKDETDNTENE